MYAHIPECAHVCVCAHTRKCAYVYLLCPCASLMFLHLVKFRAGAVRLAHKLLLRRRNRGMTEAFCLFQCQWQPHRSDKEEEAAGSPFGMPKGLQQRLFSFAKEDG